MYYFWHFSTLSSYYNNTGALKPTTSYVHDYRTTLWKGVQTSRLCQNAVHGTAENFDWSCTLPVDKTTYIFQGVAPITPLLHIWLKSSLYLLKYALNLAL